MGSAGSDGPTVAFRIVIEHEPGKAPDVDAVLDALQGCGGANYIEVHPAGHPCEEVGHLQGDPCPRCENLKETGGQP